MNIGHRGEMERQFSAIVERLQINPFHTPQAISHTYEIARDEDGGRDINPMTLWDLHR